MASLEEKIERDLRRDLPVYEYMDLRIESASNGVYRCAVPLNEGNTNHFHTIHAAIQWAVAEVLGGLVWAEWKPAEGDFIPVVKRFEIDFKRPAFTRIVAETRFSAEQAQTLRAALAAEGRHDFELGSVIRNDAGETVAEAKGTYAIRPARAVSGSR